MVIDTESIPDGMKQYDHWICWEVGERNGKKTKLPRAPWEVGHTLDVDANDPDNWTILEEAYDWASKMTGWGIGFVFSVENPYVGIDLDDCIKDGQIMPSAVDILSRVQSYAEVSPSGTGIHIICLGELDNALKNDERGVELYDRDRYFTVTGNVLGDDPKPITEAQEAVEFLMDEYMIEEDEPPSEDPDIDTSPPGNIPDTEHPLYDLTVRDVYPTLSHGDNIEHPVHGSTTGSNFKIHPNDPTAICWRGEHQHGSKMGCVLCAWHLLAMEALNEKNCRKVRRQYPHNDKMVFAAWKEAYNQGLVSGYNPPWRAVNHVAQRKGLEEHLDEGGKSAWAVYRACCRLIRSEHDIPVKIDDE